MKYYVIQLGNDVPIPENKTRYIAVPVKNIIEVERHVSPTHGLPDTYMAKPATINVNKTNVIVKGCE